MQAPPQPKFGLYVGNVDNSVSVDVLKSCFAQYGAILHATLNGRESDPFRYAFLDFANEADRNRALAVNGYSLAGRPLKVGISKGSGGSGGPRGQADAGASLPPPVHGAGYARRDWRGVNELPSDRVMKMRELQKKQYFEVVETLAAKIKDKMERKLRSRSQSVDSTDSRAAKEKKKDKKKDKSEKKEKKDKKSKKEKKEKKSSKDKKPKRSRSRSSDRSRRSSAASSRSNSPASARDKSPDGAQDVAQAAPAQPTAETTQ